MNYLFTMGASLISEEGTVLPQRGVSFLRKSKDTARAHVIEKRCSMLQCYHL